MQSTWHLISLSVVLPPNESQHNSSVCIWGTELSPWLSPHSGQEPAAQINTRHVPTLARCSTPLEEPAWESHCLFHCYQTQMASMMHHLRFMQWRTHPERVSKRGNAVDAYVKKFTNGMWEKRSKHTEAPMWSACVCVCACKLFKHTQAECCTSSENSERLHLVCGWDNMSRQSSLTSCELSWSF